MTQRQTLTAFIYDKKGRVLSVGKNSYLKSHPLQFYHAKKVGLPDKIMLHAEVDAICRLPSGAKPYRIFVARTMKDGSYGLAKPCPVCQSAIKAAGIEVVQFTDKE